MAKIKLVVSATIGETFSDFIISKKTKGLAEKTLQSYQAQFQAVGAALGCKDGHCHAPKGGFGCNDYQYAHRAPFPQQHQQLYTCPQILFLLVQ